MSRDIYRYRFDDDVPVKELHESLILARLATECLHGESRVRMDASYRFDRDRRVCVIDATTEVGRDMSQLFTGLATMEFGRGAFRVERIERDRQPQHQEA